MGIWLGLIGCLGVMLCCLRYIDTLLGVIRSKDAEIEELEALADERLEDCDLYSRWVTVLLAENARLREEHAA